MRSAFLCLALLAISTHTWAGASASGATLEPSGSTAGATHGEESDEDLAKMAQNPVANMVSVPFQWSMGFGAGPFETYESTLNIQPVIPFSLTKDWNVITRTILPIVSWPLARSESHVAGIGDMLFTAFLSPAHAGRFIWGVGPVLLLPTASSSGLGLGQWGIGPSLVGLYMSKDIVAGALVNNIWTVGGWGDKDVSAMTLQPFFNYNFPSGWYLTTSPIITANWTADSSRDVWTVPVGGGVGKVLRLGSVPLTLSIQTFYNVASPQFGADWSIRFQCQFLFPK